MPDLSPACPVHSLIRQLDRLGRLARELDRPASDLPLFPDALGRESSKHAAVSTIFSVVERTGASIRDAHGSYLYGGHSLRTGGAYLLASRGVNPHKIQSLGRWRSDLVIRYAGEAMSTGIATDMHRARDHPTDDAR